MYKYTGKKIKLEKEPLEIGNAPLIECLLDGSYNYITKETRRLLVLYLIYIPHNHLWDMLNLYKTKRKNVPDSEDFKGIQCLWIMGIEKHTMDKEFLYKDALNNLTFAFELLEAQVAQGVNIKNKILLECIHWLMEKGVYEQIDAHSLICANHTAANIKAACGSVHNEDIVFYYTLINREIDFLFTIINYAVGIIGEKERNLNSYGATKEQEGDN